MSIAEQVEMQKLAERVAELERKLATLEARQSCPRKPRHLKDKKHG